VEPPRRAPIRLLLAALAIAWASSSVRAQDDDACLACHDRTEGMLAEEGATASRPVAGLLVDGALFKRSVHGAGVSCADCHAGHEEFPHPQGTRPAACATCHADQAAVFATSVHGAPREGQPRLPVDCSACHGVHDVLPATDRQSRLHPLNVYRACGQCHFEADAATETPEQMLREKYSDDTHAHGILRAGLAVSATCVSCHGGHEIKAKGDPGSRVSRLHVQDTCGTCHVGVLEEYRESVHALHADGIEPKGATCTDCHPPHDIAPAGDDFRIATNAACSRCHSERAGTFLKTQHGKLTSLGFRGPVASCSTCHENHRILPRSDPRSAVNPANVVATCSRCHEGANAQFAAYVVHADPTDPAKDRRLYLAWQTMRWLLIVVLALGGAHVLLWLNRSIAAGALRRRRAHAVGGRWIRRWPLAFVVFHVWLMSTVLVLASTGLPLHYSGTRWALTLMNVFGGPIAAGWVHRVAAVSLATLGVAFVLHLGWRLLVRRERDLFSRGATMLPRWKDVTDLVGTLRWFLFRGPQPRYDRWTYWEKFDFWAAFWGLFVIGLSGLVLWFPVQATRLVPGWFINVAVIVHGIEALLDIAFIFTVHAFHANLRPDKFPMDTLFLTGRMPEDEFKAERPLEYERALAGGELAALEDEAPTRRLRRAAYLIGTCAMALGFFFVVMMIVAVLMG